jgi:hypothetical protein
MRTMTIFINGIVGFWFFGFRNKQPFVFRNPWKLDGLYTPGENFVAIARLFAEAKAALEAGTWSESLLSCSSSP